MGKHGGFTTKNVDTAFAEKRVSQRKRKIGADASSTPPTQVFGLLLTTIFHRKLRDTAYMQEIGNIRTLYHGTDAVNLPNIAVNSLRSEKANKYCMMGPGIYFTPDIHKAFSFSRAKPTKYILVVRVALGKMGDSHELKISQHFPEKVLTQIREDGYNSIYAGAGDQPMAIGGSLNFSEVVVFRNDQVVITDVLEYKPKQKAEAPDNHFRSVSRKMFKHCCDKTINGSVYTCTSALRNGGCILHDLEYVLSMQGYCQDYEKGLATTPTPQALTQRRGLGKPHRKSKRKVTFQ